MYNPGWTVAQKKAFESLLTKSHRVEIRTLILDMNQQFVSEITSRVIDGQVTVDSGAEVTRSLSMEVLDPTRSLHLDSNSPDSGAMFANRMLSVFYSVIPPDGSARYTVPVFTGPITSLQRNEELVSISALGKESLCPRAWGERTYKAGSRVTDILYSVLRDVMGENKISMHHVPNKIPRNIAVGGDISPWETARSLARSIGKHLYYDGGGYARIRSMPATSSWAFRTGYGGSITTEPRIGFDIEGCVNAVEVLGKKPDPPKKGQKAAQRPRWVAIAPASHPMSPRSLGGSGASGQRRPRYLPEVIQDETIGTSSEAKRVAEARLAAGLLETVKVEFDSLPIPHLEEMDVASISTEKFAGAFRVGSFAIPLSVEEQMSVGYARRVTVRVPRRKA